MIKFVNLQPFTITFPCINQRLSNFIQKISQCIQDKLYSLSIKALILLFQTSQLQGNDLYYILKPCLRNTLQSIKLRIPEGNKINGRSLQVLIEMINLNSQNLKQIQIVVGNNCMDSALQETKALFQSISALTSLTDLHLQIKSHPHIAFANLSCSSLKSLKLSAQNWLSVPDFNLAVRVLNNIEQFEFKIGNSKGEFKIAHLIGQPLRVMRLSLEQDQMRWDDLLSVNLLNSKQSLSISLQFNFPLHIQQAFQKLSSLNKIGSLQLSLAQNTLQRQHFQAYLSLSTRLVHNYSLRATTLKIYQQEIFHFIQALSDQRLQSTTLFLHLQEDFSISQLLQLINFIAQTNPNTKLTISFSSQLKFAEILVNGQGISCKMLDQQSTYITAFSKQQTSRLAQLYDLQVAILEYTVLRLSQTIRKSEQLSLRINIQINMTVFYSRLSQNKIVTELKEGLLVGILECPHLGSFFYFDIQNTYKVKGRHLEIILPFDQQLGKYQESVSCRINLIAQKLHLNESLNKLTIYHASQTSSDQVYFTMRPLFFSRIWLVFQNYMQYRLSNTYGYKQLEKLRLQAQKKGRWVSMIQQAKQRYELGKQVQKLIVSNLQV